jgi:DNA polymerase (family 10)
MTVRNSDIAAVFEAMADYLEIEDENPFKIRAYRNAARTISALGPEVADMLAAGEEPSGLPGIGKELASKMREIAATGTAQAYEKLKARVPPGLVAMLRIPGLGPKRVRVLYRELELKSLPELKAAAQAGRIQALPGFGAKIEAQLIQAIDAAIRHGRRLGIALARPRVELLLDFLRRVPGVSAAEAAGSFRRCKDTVGDIDLLVTAEAGSPVMERFTAFDEAGQVLVSGPTQARILLRSGLQVDLRRVEPGSFGAALQYFTGSQAHNVAIRRLGRKLGLKINEYGVFSAAGKVAGETEESVYRALGLPWIDPELREDGGEIETAAAGALPALVALSDLKGDLHSHTTATDGRGSLEEMALAARESGLSYLAVTDHSQQLRMVGGLDARRLMAQLESIEHLNATLAGITLLKGIEVEILEDGRLDLPQSVLKHLDLVIGSVHSHFNLPLKQQTERILRAMDHRYFSILGHPSGRLIGERDAYDVDMAAVVRKARERGCFLELNANPQRLDATDTDCRMAREAGVLVAVNSDAHRTRDFDLLGYGIGQARRGWLEKKDVLNTRPLPELKRLLEGTMA